MGARNRKATTTPQRRALLVLGMHRSGTSALARVFSLRGASLPEHVMPANRGNESGYWEPEAVVRLNDRILESFGASWDDPFAASLLPPPGGFPEAFAQEARNILQREYGGAELFVLKDPRCTLLLGFWNDVLRSIGVVPCPVVIMRPFAEVADSLLRRDMTNATSAVLLYVGYGLEAAAARDAGASVVTYAQLVADWRATTDRAAREHGIAWPRDDAQAVAEIEFYLQPPAREPVVPELPAQVAGWADRVWGWFAQSAQGEHPAAATLARVRAELAGARELLAPLLADRKRQIAELRHTLEGSQSAMEQVVYERDMALAERDTALRIHQSTEAQLHDAQANYQKLELQRTELERALRDVAGSREELVAERDRALQAHGDTEAQLRDTQASYQSLERKRSDLEGALQAVAGHRESLMAERDQALRAHQSTETLLHEVQASYRKLEEQRAELEGVLQELAGHCEGLTVERDHALRMHQGTEARLHETEASYRDLDHRHAELQATLKDLADQRDLLLAERDQALRAQQGTEKRLHQTEARYRQLDGRQAELEETLKALADQRDGLQAERDRAIRAHQGAEEQLHRTEASYRQMEARQGELMGQFEGLRAERDGLIQMQQRIEQQLQKVEADYQARLRQAFGTQQQLEAERDLQRAEIEALRGHVDAVNHELAQHQAEIEELQDGFAVADQQVQRLQARVGELDGALVKAAAERDLVVREIRAIHASHSWRVTAPLRGLSQWIRRILGRPASAPMVLPALQGEGTSLLSAAAPTLLEPVFRKRKHRDLRRFLVEEFTAQAADDAVLRIDRYRLPVESSGVRAATKISCTEPEALNWATAIARQASQRINADAVPDVSIVIPVYNQLPFTLACIDALLAHETRYRFEILVGDDASSDATALALATPIAGVRHVRHDTNLGFVRNCNATAALARGRYVVMLNNDTQVLPGWLDELVGTLEDNPGVGLSGSKLVFPDGRLQECGGIVWRDGSAWNFGRLQDPRRPEFCYMRDTDYVSGASIALPMELWRELGGFDELFVPAYAEDVDLAFRIRARGLRTVVQPLSQLLHFEGVSSGTDTTQGAKAYQVENLRKLHERWHETLQGHRDNADRPELEKERGVARRMLFVDLVTPTPKEDAGSLVAVEMMNAFRDNGCKITFIPADNFAHMGASTRDLQRAGIEAIYHPSYSSMDAFLSQCKDEFDAILLVRFAVGEAHLERLRRRYPSAPIIFSNCDLHYLRQMREAEISGSQAALAAAIDTKRRETEVIRRADVNLVHSEAELELLQRDVPGAPCVLFPLVHDPIEHCAPLAGRDGICFVGGYRHAPNADGIRWFVEKVWPLVMARDTAHKLYIAGSSMTDEVRALAEHPNVEVVGFVDDLEGFLAQRRAAIAPLRFGAGAKGKVAVSLANGVPVVSTSVGAEGMQLTPGTNVLVANSADGFAEHILDILGDDNLWSLLSSEGMGYAANITSRASARQRARAIIEMLRLG